MKLPILAGAAVVVILLGVGAWLYFARKAQDLTEKDTIVLSDFTNGTGDAIFDDTLKTALNVSLRQSPFLNVFSDSEVAKNLKLMTRPPDTKLTPEVARELCRRAGSKAYLAGTISSLGRQYVLGLKAVNCRSGDTLKAAQTYQEAIDLGNVYAAQGQYEKAAEVTRQALRLAPERLALYGNLANYNLALQRLDETRQVIHDAQARKLDDFVLRNALYALAFLGSDSAAMADQQQWFAGKPEENDGLALASDTEAYAGHVGKARELTKRAMDSAIRAGNKEEGAIWQANAALQQAAYGNMRKRDSQRQRL